MKRHSCAEIVPIFNHLDKDSLIKISSITRHKSYTKGDIIYSPNKAPALFILAKGKIKEYQISINGKEQLLRVLGPGRVLGESSLFDSQPPETYAEAISDIEVCYISKDELINLLLEYPTISIKILEEYNRRLKEADNQTTRIATESVSSRIASYLIDLSVAENSNKFTLPLNMKELAAFLATSPETLSRRLRNFEEKNIIKRDGKVIHILNIDMMKEIKE